MKMRRVFGLGACLSLTGMAACTAIAGLDGTFELGDGDVSPGTDSGLDANSSPPDGQATDTERPDGDAPDRSPPVDACASYTLDAGSADAKTPPVENCSAGGRYFCWRFQGSGQPDASPWGWQEQNDSGAGLVEIDFSAGALRTVLPAGAPGGSSASLWFTDWESSTPEIDPLSIPKNSGVEFTFKFKLVELNTNAALGAIRINKGIYGLTAYAPRCGGPIVVGQSDDDPTVGSGGVVIELDKPYIGSVRVFRKESDTWEGRVAVNGQTVATRSVGAIPNGPPVGVGVGVGFIEAAPNIGRSEAFFDDTVVFP